MFTKYRILIFSPNPDALMKFYRDVLNLKLREKVDIPNDYGYMFEIKDDMWLWIGRHSEVHGKNKDQFRHIFNLYPEGSVLEWYEKIKACPGVEIICQPQLTPFAIKKDPWYVCTFLDPEGNCWQFMGQK